MLQCVICGEDLSKVDAFAKFSINGEFFEYLGKNIQPSGQTFQYVGVRMCPKHASEIARRVEDNLSITAKARKKKEEAST